MENNQKTFAENLADAITQGTKEAVEKTGQTYKPSSVAEFDKDNLNATDDERAQFGKQLAGEIKKGTKEQQKYDKWYEKEYGTKNVPIISNTVDC